MSLPLFAIDNNLLVGARHLHSPNQSERSAESDIELLVIHNISLPPGEFGTHCVEQFFCNSLDTSQHPFFQEIADLKVSAHLLIDRTGAVTQFVPFDKKAWHAGQSVFCGRDNCNEFSVGIELEGTDNEPFTEAQYQVLTAVSVALMRSYPHLILDRIVGHSDIAPGRKTDPGPCFDWSGYKNAVQRALRQATDED